MVPAVLCRWLALARRLALVTPSSAGSHLQLLALAFVATLILVAREFLICSKLHPTSLSFGVGF